MSQITRWHHIAYSKYADTYTLFIDGEVVKNGTFGRLPRFCQ